MFSANQIGFIQISTLTYYHAISWAVLCIVTLVLGIISRFITGKETSNLIIGRKVTWMMFYSILYFIVTFLVY